MDTKFTVSPKVLESLGPAVAVKAFRNLLWCEARRIGLSLHKAAGNLATTVSDGGIDAKIEGMPHAEPLLIAGNIFFQIKTGRSFKPWQTSSLKQELFGQTRSKPSKELLSKGAKTCLDKDGRYVLVAFGHDMTPSQRSAAQQNLEDIFDVCGYGNPKAEVLGQGQLIDLFSNYPSLCLELLDRTECVFQTVEAWKANEGMASTLQMADAQKGFVENVRSAVRGGEFQHIRIIGEPGIGKTRLVLEAMAANDLSPATVYVPHAEDFQKSQLFDDLLQPDRHYFAHLVIDDCEEKDRASIWSAIKGKPDIKLITIDHGLEAGSDGATKIFECPLLPDEQLAKIIAGHVADRRNISKWAKWCCGSPGTAHAVGENLKRNPDDLLKSPAVPIWDRFILGRKTRGTIDAEQQLLVTDGASFGKKQGAGRLRQGAGRT